MTPRAAVAAAALTVVAAGAAPAAAGDHVYRCDFRWSQLQDVTGSGHQAYAYGFVAGDADDAVSVACEVRVNHITVDSTPAGSGRAVAVTGAPVSVAAEDGDVLELCALVTLNGTTNDHCGPLSWGLDRALCTAPAGLAGGYGPLAVTADGDVSLVGERYWDCPPYDASA